MMGRPDAIEFYLNSHALLLSVQSAHAPAAGELVNFRQKTYKVMSRSYTVDHADEQRETQVVCVVMVTPLDPG